MFRIYHMSEVVQPGSGESAIGVDSPQIIARLSQIAAMLDQVMERLHALQQDSTYFSSDIWNNPVAAALYNEIGSAGYHLLCFHSGESESEIELDNAVFHLSRAKCDAHELMLARALKRLKRCLPLLVGRRLKRKERAGATFAPDVAADARDEVLENFIDSLREVFSVDAIMAGSGTQRIKYYENELPRHNDHIRSFLNLVFSEKQPSERKSN